MNDRTLATQPVPLFCLFLGEQDSLGRVRRDEVADRVHVGGQRRADDGIGMGHGANLAPTLTGRNTVVTRR